MASANSMTKIITNALGYLKYLNKIKKLNNFFILYKSNIYIYSS